MTQARYAVAFFLTAFIAICSSPHVQGQQINRDDWLRQMKDEEGKVKAYIETQMKKTTFNDSLKQVLLSSSEFHEHPITDASSFIDANLRSYYRIQYFNTHPEAVAVYNPGRVSVEPLKEATFNAVIPPTSILCNYGDFETATSGNLTSQGYNGYVAAYPGAAVYPGSVCDFVPLSNVSYTNVGFGSWTNFLVTNNAPDPNVSALWQTHKGSKHAIRVNAGGPCPAPAEINMLQKSFTPSVTGRSKILFSYAMVAENPPYNHMAANTFFLARVLDNTGTEVGARVCLQGIPTSPFNLTPFVSCGWRDAKIMWKDWTCEEIQFDAQAGITYTIEFFVADCAGGMHFAYAYVDDICAQTCCPPAPENVKCEAVPEGNHISWNAVPDAIGYQVTIHSNDPACCKDSHIQFMSTWTVTGTDTLIPNTFTKCFSYTVNSICKDSTVSETLQKYCSCAPECPAPLNPRCNPVNGGSDLVWDPVPGATGYQVILHSNDPFCCGNNGAPQFMAVWTVTGTDTVVPSTFSGCFSWTVNTLCEAGLVSQSLQKYCSCTPPCQAPTNLTCYQLPYGSVLGWSTVPGAAYYKLVIYNNDPKCCHNGSLPFMAVFNTITTNYVIPTSFSQCFSWYVNTVCEDSSISQTLESSCSCSPDNPDPRLRSQAEENMSRIMSNMTERVQASAAPNPASTYIDFALLSLDQLAGDSKLVLYLYDINGREIMSKETGYNKNLRVNVEEFPTGTYIYEFKDAGKKIANGKVIIDRH